MALSAMFGKSTRSLLPVRKRSGRDELVVWARKSDEPGSLHDDTTLPLEAIKRGEWREFKPRWVKLHVDRFMTHNIDGEPVWNEVPHGCYLQGLLLRDNDMQETRRVYVVTIEAPEEVTHLTESGRWPHISQPDYY